MQSNQIIIINGTLRVIGAFLLLSRRARTHRLIQEGAILEKTMPQVRQMSLEQLEGYLCSLIK